MKKRFSSIILVIAIIASSFMCFGTITASATGTVDITQDFTMTNLGQGISADTTTIGFVFGSHSSLPASGVGYYINDNPNSNGIDPLSFIEINGKNAREIVSENQNNVTSYTGTAFPMNIGGVYSPVLAFCEQGYIRISILHNYLPSGAYTITLKSGFTWNNNNGETLVITSDVTYAYDKDGNFSKVSNIVDTNSMLSIVNYLTNNVASEYSYIDIEATSDIFTDYNYTFFDTAFGSGGFLPYIEINGRTGLVFQQFNLFP
ncbi:MAG: hypothetical protein MJ212_06535, partial [Alphaproteobacteria bacterium]|nr:hypothetical protein [Alphaproteobacteria bacterium]